MSERPYAQIPVAMWGSDRILWAKVDLADYDTVAHYSWTVTDDGDNRYAVTTRGRGRRLQVGLGQLILGQPAFRGARVNYINGNPMDARRANLAWATQSQILAKRRPSGGASRFKGVALERGLFLVRFRGKFVGRYKDEEQAARAFDDAAFAYWGHHAYLNFPDRYAGRQPGDTPRD